jgi:putative transposase
MLARVHHALYIEARRLSERADTPSLAIIDSQSVKSAEKGGARSDPSGYDAAKKIKGKKRHIAVDTLGLMVGLIVTPGDIQDRDCASTLLKMARTIRRRSSTLLPTAAIRALRPQVPC